MDDLDKLKERLKEPDIHFFEEGEIIQKLLASGKTQLGLAVEIGVSQSTVRNKLRCLNISDDCKDLIVKNKVSEKQVRSLITIVKREGQKEAVLKIIKSQTNCKASNKAIEEKAFYKENISSNSLKSKKCNPDAFIGVLKDEISRFRHRGLNIQAKRINKENSLDILIRVYK